MHPALPLGGRKTSNGLPCLPPMVVVMAPGLYRLASGLLDGAAQSLTEPYYAYLVASAMLGALAQNDAAAAMKVWESYGVRQWPPDPINLYLRLLLQTTRQRVAGLVVAAP